MLFDQMKLVSQRHTLLVMLHQLLILTTSRLTSQCRIDEVIG